MEKKDNKSPFGDVLKSIIEGLVDLLKTISLKKIAGLLGMSLTGFQGWLAKLLVEKVFSTLVMPIIDHAINTGRLKYDQKKGQLVAKDIKNAKTDAELRRALNDLQ